MPRCLALGGDCFSCCFHSATTLMAEHQKQAGAQMIDRVLDAAQSFIVDHVSRHSHNKQVTEPLIEDNFGRHTRIGATDDGGERMLSLCQFRAPFRRLTGMLQIAARITAIAFLELRDCFTWSYRRLVRMNRISASGQLVNAQQADGDETSYELCRFHV